MTTALTVDPTNLTIVHIISCIQFQPTHRAKYNFFHSDYVNEINDYDRGPESFVRGFHIRDSAVVSTATVSWHSIRREIKLVQREKERIRAIGLIQRRRASREQEGVYEPRIGNSRRDLRFTSDNPISRERCSVGANDGSWPAGPPCNHRGSVLIVVCALEKANRLAPHSVRS